MNGLKRKLILGAVALAAAVGMAAMPVNAAQADTTWKYSTPYDTTWKYGDSADDPIDTGD